MMKKLKIKNWLLGVTHFAFWIKDVFFAWIKRKMSPSLKVKLTRQSLMISLPASQGGRLHVLPRPGGASGLTRTFEIVMMSEGKYAIMASPDQLQLATFSSESDAMQSLSILNKALTGNHVLKWSLRLFLVWLTWLLATSYMEVRQQQSGRVNGGVDLSENVIPSGEAPFLQIPSANNAVAGVLHAPDGVTSGIPENNDLSGYIYKQAMLAKEKAQKDALPPKASVDNAAGLAAFGLKNAEGSGEGCDPKLAFKVPQK